MDTSVFPGPGQGWEEAVSQTLVHPQEGEGGEPPKNPSTYVGNSTATGEISHLSDPYRVDQWFPVLRRDPKEKLDFWPKLVKTDDLQAHSASWRDFFFLIFLLCLHIEFVFQFMKNVPSLGMFFSLFWNNNKEN